MADDDRLIGLLVQWDERRQRGEVVSASEICGDCPDLAPELERRIADLKATDWLLDTRDEQADDFLTLPTTMATRDDTQTPRPALPLDQFAQAVADSGLLTTEEVAELRQRTRAEASLALATELIARNKLTAYQASVLLEDRHDPLLLDGYAILDKIDAGGMGVVFKAHHRSLDRIVALKTLPPEAVDSPNKVKRFEREARAAAKLDHANIVTTHDARESGGVHFLVMEYVEGSDLFKLVNEQGPLSVPRAVDYALQAARGLSHAHSRGITHRDIKPGNLLLSEDGTLKILDMGLSRIDSPPGDGKTAPPGLTESSAVMGTAAYMAPEQATDTRQADHRSDIYSLGCTLHFLLTGHTPYPEDTPVKTILAHRDEPIPSLADQRDDVPADVEVAYRRMLAKQPEERYQSVDEVIAALEACALADDDPPPMRRQPAAGTKPRSEESARRRLRPWVAAALATVLVGGIALAVIILKIKIGDKEVFEARLDLSAAKKPSPATEPPAVSMHGESPYYDFWVDFELRLRGRRYQDAQRLLSLALKDPALTANDKQLRRDQQDLKRLITLLEAARSALPETQSLDELSVEEIERLASESLDPKDPQTLLALAILHRVDQRGDFCRASKLIRQAVAAGADPRPWLAMTPEAFKNSLGMTMIQAPHRQEDSPSYLGACEVTRDQYVEVMGELPDATKLDPNLINPHGADAGTLPVTCVSWYDAILFCNALSERESLTPFYKVTQRNDGFDVETVRSKGYRLPEHHELSRAVGAGRSWVRGFSYETFLKRLDHFAWHKDNSNGRLHAVGSRLPNLLGIYDLYGNVIEWTSTRCDREGWYWRYGGRSTNSVREKYANPWDHRWATSARTCRSRGGFDGFRIAKYKQREELKEH